RTAKLAGFEDESLRGMLSGNASRIADGEEPLEPSPPRGGGTFSQPMAFARIHQYLSMATPLLWTRQADTIGVLGLALNACADRDGHADERERIRELLTAARELWRALPEVEDEGEQPLVEAFVRADALQCGFCTPGQIVSAAALVAAEPELTSERVRHAMAGNLCRCGAYPRIEEAVLAYKGQPTGSASGANR